MTTPKSRRARAEPRIDDVIRMLANASVRARPCVLKVRNAIVACLNVCFAEQDRRRAKRRRRA